MANLAQRYAAWIDANRVRVLVASVVLALGCGYLASRLRLRADLMALLPASQRSVRDLERFQDRARLFSTVHVVVESADPNLRGRTAAALRERLVDLDTDLVSQVVADDGAIYRYGWNHRFLFAELPDLVAARDALRARIERGKLAANPLYVPLDDEPVDGVDDQLTELEAKVADARRNANNPPLLLSPDGRLQLITVQTTFPTTDHARAQALHVRIKRVIAEVRAELGPGAQADVGLAGNATFVVYDRVAASEGMALSGVITVVLCALGLLLYYRSGRVVLAMLWALAVGVVATFAVALGVIGHLDLMSAFLTAIVVGNGINAGLILVARYLEEVRGGRDPRDAVGPAIGGALRGTLAATATAAIAYASLVVTDFRGFRNFGAIAGLGMALTWLTTFTILPAALFVLARGGRIRPTRPPAIGRALSRLVPRRLAIPVVAGGVLTAVAMVIAIVFVTGDPFTRDWRDLQSETAAIAEYRALDGRLRKAFEGRALLAGQAYQVAIGVDRRDQVAPVVEAIRAGDARRPPHARWLNDVRSLDDLLPRDQPAKLAVLAEIRTLIDDPTLIATLDAGERIQLRDVRPPDDLRALGDADVPAELAWPFIERDGSIGKLIVLRGSRALDPYDVADRLRFAAEVRAIELPPGAVVAGESLIVADIIETMERDAPKMIGFALAGSVLAVLAVIGLRRHGVVTIACSLAGVAVMIAACALVGLRVHFLDLIALPITIGIGIDYAVNLAARDREDGARGPHHLLSTTGAAVVLCSYTTAVAYATLMLSANGGIRAFGLAALIGEIACVAIAVLVGPAVLALLRERHRRHSAGENGAAS